MSRYQRRYRLGLIGYTNVAPLLCTLEDEFAREGIAVECVRGVPTEINELLLRGELDLANISAIEFLRHREWLRALPDFSVSVLGAVYSVNLFHRRSWSELAGTRIAVTAHSATSVALLETLLELDGIQATFERADGPIEALCEEFAAVLRIGDQALIDWHRLRSVPPRWASIPFDLVDNTEHNPEHDLEHDRDRRSTASLAVSPIEPIEVTDLAMRWYERTNMPFVFALWVAPQSSAPPAELVQAMRRARDWGLGHLAQVAAVEAKRLGLPRSLVQHYLWNFRYHLEPPDRLGLSKFASLALPASKNDVTFWEV